MRLKKKMGGQGGRGGSLESVPQSVFGNQDVDLESRENNIQHRFHSLSFKIQRTKVHEGLLRLRVWEFFENEQRLAEVTTLAG